MQKTASSLWGSLFQLALLLVCGIAIGFLLLVAVYALPVEPIAAHVKLSVPSVDGSWETGEIAYEQLVKGYVSTQLDNSTDANMLLAAAHDNDLPLLQRAASPATYTLDSRCFPALLEFGQTGSSNLTSNPIARYWHGYLVWLKPLLCIMSYMDIRMLQMIAQLLLLCAVIAGFVRRGLLRITPAFALSLLMITPSITGFSLQFSTVYTLFMLAVLALLCCPALLGTRYRMAAFFLLTGMLTSYLDYLTYPIATFGMPFIVSVLLQPTSSRRDALLRFAICLGSWLAGYFGMWAGKWVIALLFSGDPWFFANLLAKVSERSSHIAENTVISVGSVLRSVFSVYFKKAYLLVGAVAVATYVTLWVRNGRKRGGVKPNLPMRPSLFASGLALVLLLTGLLPPVWYLLTANHTFDHAFFTSRALVVSAFAGFTFCAALLRRNQVASRRV